MVSPETTVTARRSRARLSMGWRRLAWSSIALGMLVLGFAVVIVVSASIESANTSGGDDSLAPLGAIIAGLMAAPAVLGLGLGGLSFVRALTASARKTLIVLATMILGAEVMAILGMFASWA